MKWARTNAVAVFVASFSMLPSGCLICGGSTVQYGGKGPMVSPETLKQIEPGKTTRGKLVALLGEPSGKKKLDEESELYTYDYVKKTHNGVAIFLLLAAGDTKEERSRLYFEIQDDVVRKFWKDTLVN